MSDTATTPDKIILNITKENTNRTLFPWEHPDKVESVTTAQAQEAVKIQQREFWKRKMRGK